MSDVSIGKGNLAGKGVYAEKDFKRGDVVIKYSLKPISQEEFNTLPKNEIMFTHTHWGQIYLYSEPERYVNDSKDPNTLPDLKLQADVAVRDISKGEMITTDSKYDDIS